MEHLDVAVIGGGQSGLATAHALSQHGITPVVLEASDRAAGSWPRYYDGLTLFSPARYSSLPGMPFPGADPDRYPHRDEVVDYLTSYAARLDADIRTGRRVTAVRPADGKFEVELAGGGRLAARTVVAASGTFGRPHRPPLPGLEGYSGTLLHAADYRSPEPFAGQRVVVVGAGNSAVQIAAELATVARVSLASRGPVKFARQHIGGRDLHFWLKRTGLDIAPLGRLLRTPPTQLVIDDGRYRAALAQEAPDRRELFTGLDDGTKALWPDGTREEVDAIILATGYRPDLPYLSGLDGALDAAGHPRHRDGASLTHPGLAFVGLEWQRSLSPNSLRGVGRDADRVVWRLVRHLTRGRPLRTWPAWFDMCQHRRMSNVKVLSLIEPADGQAVAPCCPPLTERPFSAEEAEVAARMFKALGDPVRLRLFSAVASHEGGEACVCDISDVGVSQPTVSHHLKKLKEAGLLTSERRGTWVYYRVEPSVFAAMGQLLTTVPAVA